MEGLPGPTAVSQRGPGGRACTGAQAEAGAADARLDRWVPCLPALHRSVIAPSERPAPLRAAWPQARPRLAGGAPQLGRKGMPRARLRPVSSRQQRARPPAAAGSCLSNRRPPRRGQARAR